MPHLNSMGSGAHQHLTHHASSGLSGSPLTSSPLMSSLGHHNSLHHSLGTHTNGLSHHVNALDVHEGSSPLGSAQSISLTPLSHNGGGSPRSPPQECLEYPGLPVDDKESVAGAWKYQNFHSLWENSELLVSEILDRWLQLHWHYLKLCTMDWRNQRS